MFDMEMTVWHYNTIFFDDLTDYVNMQSDQQKRDGFRSELKKKTTQIFRALCECDRARAI